MTVEGLRDIRLVPVCQHDGVLSNALAALLNACSKITIGDWALPLPPIKRDNSKLNNINFQISAAQAGLALVKSEYVLRIRSDLIFLDHTFLADYIEGCALPRGSADMFEQRVMISWLYTLNPYSIERLPLHFSDWFHLGLTRDVVRMWDVPPMTMADSVYYSCHDYLVGSNNAERLFLVRVAVEQYIAYNAFKKNFPSLCLEFHNDLRSRELSMNILVDNFVVCDVLASRGFFDKYNVELFNQEKRMHCITAETWRELCLASQESPAEVIYRISQNETPGRVTQSKDKIFSNLPVVAASPSGALPLCYDAFQLKIKKGNIKNKEIISSEKDGVISFGPYITLPNGSYIASIYCSQIDGDGIVTCCVTAYAGRVTLSKKDQCFRYKENNKIIYVPFIIKENQMYDIEVVVSINNICYIAIQKIEIDVFNKVNV